MPVFIAILGLASAFGPPPPLRDDEPLPWPRAPELARRPVELLPAAKVSLPRCEEGAGRARCDELGPSFGGELSALYRPTPYFAFGATAGYGVARGSVSGGALAATTLTLGVAARVYLLETGELDPYLDALFGWGALTTTLEAPNGLRDTDSAYGPLGRAGGGVDWMLSPTVKLGFNAGFMALLLARGERCHAGYCSDGPAVGGAMSGALTAGLELGILLGNSL
jgi:hypothetical protein